MLQDIRLAIRSAARTPAVTSVIVVSLALGIGANTTIFTLINAVFLRPLPIKEPERLAYSVTRRTKEIGIRMALGAEHADVLRMVLRQGLKLTSLGAAIGLVAAFGGTRLIANLLFVSPTDGPTFAAISLLLAAVAMAASFLPARRAARVDSLVALRHDS